MGNKEAQIGNEIIGEETKISLSVKTAIWIIGGTITLFSTLFTLAYFDIKSDMKDYKEKVQVEKEEYFNKVSEKLNKEVERMYDKNEEMIKDIGDIKGNVKVILDRTSGMRSTEGVSTYSGSNATPPPLPSRR
jgi:hypothetical protein